MKIMETVDNSSKVIKTFDEWQDSCRKKMLKRYKQKQEGEVTFQKQWNDTNKSSPLMAKYWLTNGIDTIFEKYFTEIIGNPIYLDTGIPEYEAKFDCYKNPRQHDLFIYTSDKKTLISIEAKSKESWKWKEYKTFKQEYGDAKNDKKLRCDKLLDVYFLNNEDINDIIYQILTWFAGSLADAINCNSENIIMILQQFYFETVDINQKKDNFDEYIKFIKILEDKPVFKKCQNICRNWDNTIYSTGPIMNKYTKDKKLYLLFLLCKQNNVV